MENTGHNLQITNYKPGDNLPYQIVLIKGVIRNNKCIRNENTIIVNEQKFAVSPKNTFKSLLKLKEGSNIIRLKYCCHSQTFELFHEQAKTLRRHVSPLYIIFRGHDGSIQTTSNETCSPTNTLNKINLNCQLIQTVLAEKLFETHQKHLTFHLTEAKIFHSEMSIDDSHKTEPSLLFHKLACEIEKSPCGNPLVKHMAFLSGTQYHGELYNDQMNYEALVKITEQYIALGRGGLAVFHTACLYSWPVEIEDVMKAFNDDTPIDRTQLLDDSNYRGTMGACYSTTLGSILHELCHTFDLGHADDGIMSRGFDDVRDIFLVDSADAIEADRRKGAHGITDSTALHKSGVQILRYNKWFLNEEHDLPYMLNFDPVHKVIQSSWGIKVIEIRSGDDEVVTQNWIYRVAKMKVQIELQELREYSKIFIQDSKGNTLTCNLSV